MSIWSPHGTKRIEEMQVLPIVFKTEKKSVNNEYFKISKSLYMKCLKFPKYLKKFNNIPPDLNHSPGSNFL